jgi:hypothetical protein
MTTRIAITSSLFLGIAMLLLPSAQAMSPPPLHQSDGIRADVGYRGGARGHRYGVARGYGVRRYGYGGYNRYGYRGYGYRAYRPYGYGVARRQVRRCALWGAGHVCRKWVY